MQDTRRLTKPNLYICGTTGSDTTMNDSQSSESWTSRIFPRLCNRIAATCFQSKYNMEVKEPDLPIVIPVTYVRTSDDSFSFFDYGA